MNRQQTVVVTVPAAVSVVRFVGVTSDRWPRWARRRRRLQRGGMAQLQTGLAFEQSTSRRCSHLVVGVLAVLAGAAVMLRPFASLGALTLLIGVSLIVAGIGELLDDASATAGGWRWIGGGLLVLTGVVASALPGTTIRLVAVVVGVGLVVSGIAQFISGVRGTHTERYSAVVGGAARLLLGAVALSWPDVTLLVVALLVGPVAIVIGIGQIATFIGRPRTAASGRPRPGWLRWLRAAWVTVALVVAVALVFVSRSLHGSAPMVDAFYAAPSTLPDTPGQLLRSEPFSQGMPAGSRAWRILYTTTRVDGTIGVASGLVLVSSSATGAMPVIAWTHGTTGVAQTCAPTLLADPLGAGAAPAVQHVLDNGWALVATDYIGLGTQGPHPYLVGRPEAHSELDAVRAARQLTDIQLSDQTVAWGHSQGGGAALWVGIESKTYAPDVPLAGVAALAPASDLSALMSGLQNGLSGKVFGPFILEGYSTTYPDVKIADYVRPAARTIVEQINTRCLPEPATLVSVLSAIATEQIYSTDGATGPLGARLKENTPSQPTGIPTLLAQGEADELVLPDVQTTFVKNLCAAGQVVDYRTYAGLDHVGIVTNPTSAMPADLISWTQDRLANKPDPPKCTTTTR